MPFLLVPCGSAAFRTCQDICIKRSRQKLFTLAETVYDLKGHYSFTHDKKNPCSVLEESGCALSFTFYTTK